MRLCVKIIFAILIFTTFSDAWGFDGQRKGFVIGGGLGFAPIAKWSAPDIIRTNSLGDTIINMESNDTQFGLGINLLIGYAWDEHNMIVYEGNSSGYKSNFRQIFGVNERALLIQGFFGAAWYHYFRPAGSTLFSVVGVGLYSFEIDDGSFNFDYDNRFGGLLGGGYEFSRHWQITAYLSIGKTSRFDGELSHTNLSVLVSAVAF